MSDTWDERFGDLIRSHLRFLPADEPLRPDSNLFDLGLDSMDTVQLLLALEEEYGGMFPDDALTPETFSTPASLWEAVSLLPSPKA